MSHVFRYFKVCVLCPRHVFVILSIFWGFWYFGFLSKFFFLELHHWFDLVERNGHWGDLSHFFVVLGFAHFFRQFTFSIFAIYLDRFRLWFIKIYEGTGGNWNFDLFFVYPIVNSKYQAILFLSNIEQKKFSLFVINYLMEMHSS